MLDKLDQALGFHQKALQVRSLRQEVLASNIANADTPGYRAKDLNFQDALQASLQAGLSSTAPAKPAVELRSHVHERPNTSQAALDGNAVSLDQERKDFLENAVRYEAGLTLISQQIRGLQAAIQN